MLTQRIIERQLGGYILGSDRSPQGIFTPAALDQMEYVLSVHRNNFCLNLVQSLTAVFPAVANLVGDECFAAIAGNFARTHPPISPVLSAYGGDFPEFLEDCEIVAGIPFLGDVARIDWAWNTAYHAEDAMPLSPEGLQHILAQSNNDLRLRLHPSLRILLLGHSVYEIWYLARQPENFPDAIEVADYQQYIAVMRPQLNVESQTLDAGTYTLLSALLRGLELETALRLASEVAPQFVPEGSLGQLVARGAFISCKQQE